MPPLCALNACGILPMDEEFQALAEYVKNRLFVKVSMALDATWKKKKA